MNILLFDELNPKCEKAIISAKGFSNMMKVARRFLILIFILGLFVAGGQALYYNYGVLFSVNIVGEIYKVERVNTNLALLTTGQGGLTPQIFSFAVGIKDRNTGQIWAASSEDRQWAIAKEGLCVEAQFLPYPPWDFAKKGTYHGARLIRLFECTGSAAGVPAAK